VKGKAHWLVMILFCGFAVFPILWGIRTSLSPEYERSLFPSRVTLEHYRKIISEGLFYRYAVNSAIVSIGSLMVVAPLSLGAGYALARFRFWGRKVGPLLLAFPLLPAVTFLVPLARYLNVLGLYDSLGALILANSAFCIPFCMWMMRNFVHAVPPSLEEAALLDGCGRFSLLWRIVLPCAFPGLMAVTVFVFVQVWNNFLFAYALTTAQDLQVLPKAVVGFIGSWRTDWGGLMAMGVLTLIPPVAVFQVLQKWFVAGMYGLGTK
jgi:ABC-type glycerol-3-phosphate transport system permease component